MEWIAAVLAAEPTAMPGSMSQVADRSGEFEVGGLAAQGFGVVEEFGAGGVAAGAAVVVGRLPAWQQADEQDRVDGFGGLSVAEPDPLAAFLAAGPHPGCRAARGWPGHRQSRPSTAHATRAERQRCAGKRS